MKVQWQANLIMLGGVDGRTRNKDARAELETFGALRATLILGLVGHNPAH